MTDPAVLRQLHSMLDTNGDGRISFDELIEGLSKLKKV